MKAQHSPMDESVEWSDIIVAAMKLGGIDNLFFVSGTELNFYQEAIAKAHATGRPAPRLVTMTHENVALNAAIGNAMYRREPAATAVHVDAGTLHQGAAIHTAWRSGTPILMTAGAGPRGVPGSMPGARDFGVQWMQEPRDQASIVRQYTKADHRMEHQDDPGLMISRLLQIAVSEPAGPVYLTIPRETAMLRAASFGRFPTRDDLGIVRPVIPIPEDVEKIADWLVNAENPMICTERSGRDPEAVTELVKLAELLAIPISETGRADRLNFPTTHWAYRTGPAVRDADVILVLDAIVPYLPEIDSPSPDARIVWSSTDPVLSRFKTMEYRADLWLPTPVSPLVRTIREISESLLNDRLRRRIAERRERLIARKRDLNEQARRLVDADVANNRLTGRVLAHEIGQILEPGSIVLNDVVSSGKFIQTHAQRDMPQTYYRSGSSSGGWGSGGAFGIKLAAPNSDVIHATGDGYFMFGEPLSALWASGHHGAPYLAVVFVNGSYSTGTSNLNETYPGGYAVSTRNYDGGLFRPPPDFSKLAEAANGYGEDVTDLADVAPALQRGLNEVRSGVPAVIAVHVSEDN